MARSRRNHFQKKCLSFETLVGTGSSPWAARHSELFGYAPRRPRPLSHECHF